VGGWRGWQQAGLVSIGFSAVFGLTLLSFVGVAPYNRSDLSVLAFLSGAAMSAMTYAYCRRADLTRILVLASIGILNICTVALANMVWQARLEDNGNPIFPLLVLTVGVLIAGPAVGVLGIPIRRRLAQ
jgi:hypothetical protein